jgi:hypothetical protein
MKLARIPFRWALLALAAALVAPALLRADVIETKNGARIVGKITSIHGGTITVTTDYAGELKVTQALVTSITTDAPVAIRLTDKKGMVGILSSPAPGQIRITGPVKTVDTSVARLAAAWSVGETDPDWRKWSFEAAADVSGKSGNEHALNTSYSARAKLSGPTDTLQLYTSYARQETDGQLSADQFKAGVDYADNFNDRRSWYVRDEVGFDHVNDISVYDLSATGLGYDLVKIGNVAKSETLTARAGLSYRYDEYSAVDTASLSTSGADLGLEYNLKVKHWDLVDRLSYDPAFQNLNNYIISHEFAFNIPITKSLWKLSTGVSNAYNSKPAPGVDKLDTLYFTRLVLTWGVGNR